MTSDELCPTFDGGGYDRLRDMGDGSYAETVAGITFTPNADAFGRQRVSEPVTLFDSQHQYKLDPFKWDTGLSVNGTVTHLPNESSVSLSTAAGTSANSAIIQTKSYHRYQPGKSQDVNMTFPCRATINWREVR